MKATGIVRRIDDLGRIVIPKEIRKAMHIKEGDPLEVFTEKDAIIFKKYRPSIIDYRAIKKTVKILLPASCAFAIYDENEDLIEETESGTFPPCLADCPDETVIKVKGHRGEMVCAIAIDPEAAVSGEECKKIKEIVTTIINTEAE